MSVPRDDNIFIATCGVDGELYYTPKKSCVHEVCFLRSEANNKIYITYRQMGRACEIWAFLAQKVALEVILTNDLGEITKALEKIKRYCDNILDFQQKVERAYYRSKEAVLADISNMYQVACFAYNKLESFLHSLQPVVEKVDENSDIDVVEVISAESPEDFEEKPITFETAVEKNGLREKEELKILISKEGETYIWLPRNKCFISRYSINRDGLAYNQAAVYFQNFEDVINMIKMKFSATIPTEEQMDEFLELMMLEYGTPNIGNVKELEDMYRQLVVAKNGTCQIYDSCCRKTAYNSGMFIRKVIV